MNYITIDEKLLEISQYIWHKNPEWGFNRSESTTSDDEFTINISAVMRYDDGDVVFYGKAFASPALLIEYWWVP